MQAATKQPRPFVGSFEHFLHSEVTGSIILLICTVVALVWANSPWSESYFHLLHTEIGFSFGHHAYSLSVHHWINDGLMALFFFVVGLEVKRELVVGELSSMRQAFLPVSAALGGMIIPAAIFAVLNTEGDAARGWGIPMATDIAFALGVLAMFSKRVPTGLKVFLAATAIADDIGAVLVIAVFYTEQIDWISLLDAGLCLAVLLFMARTLRIRRVGLLMIPIIGIWIGVFESGIHATIAGILVAMLVPVRAQIHPSQFNQRARAALHRLSPGTLTEDSMIQDRGQLSAIIDLKDATAHLHPPGLALEHALHPVQALVILPLFALANAGVTIGHDAGAILASPIGIGIIGGLVIGKPLGIVLLSWLAVRSGRAQLPEGVNWRLVLGAAILGGIGFTMSLFISDLAFVDAANATQAKIGILVASLLAGVIGWIYMNQQLPRAVDPGPGPHS